MPKLVLDLETQRSFDEVGGSHNKAKMGVSVVGVYHYEGDRFVAYREAQFQELTDVLKAADTVIGFNLIGFDWPVLAAELGSWVYDLPTIDLMMEAQRSLGHRVSLNAIAKATLGASKGGSGLDALAYYRQGDWDRLERYCLEDVRLTRDLYEYAKREGHLLFEKHGKGRTSQGLITMSFATSPWSDLFSQAARERLSIKILYGHKERLIEVHSFDGVYIKAYCHLKKDILTFRIDRVIEAEKVASSTPLFS
jgi:DEAD/DEAH box helicase domain-containing protein